MSKKNMTRKTLARKTSMLSFVLATILMIFVVSYVAIKINYRMNLSYEDLFIVMFFGTIAIYIFISKIPKAQALLKDDLCIKVMRLERIYVRTTRGKVFPYSVLVFTNGYTVEANFLYRLRYRRGDTFYAIILNTVTFEIEMALSEDEYELSDELKNLCDGH